MYLLGRVIVWRTGNDEPEHSSNTEKCSFPLRFKASMQVPTLLIVEVVAQACISKITLERTTLEVASAQH